MADAIVLIDVEAGRVSEAAKTIADIPGVREVYSVAGDIDLVAVVGAKGHDGLADLIPDGIAKVPGVTHTRTLMAFKTYSGKELNAAYELGLD